MRFQPSATIHGVAGWLAARAPDAKIDWSDSWSDDDVREFTVASLKRFETEEALDQP